MIAQSISNQLRLKRDLDGLVSGGEVNWIDFEKTAEQFKINDVSVIQFKKVGFLSREEFIEQIMPVDNFKMSIQSKLFFFVLIKQSLLIKDFAKVEKLHTYVTLIQTS